MNAMRDESEPGLESTREAPRAQESLRGSRILVVDDEPHILNLVKTILVRAEADVTVAQEGMRALELLATVSPDLIILDIMMPEVDGYEVARLVRLEGRASPSPTPILLLSALSSSTAMVRGLDAGADDFLNKPFHRVELLAKAGSLVRMKRTADRVADLLELRESMANTIVHDLRTPLSAIRINAGLLSRLASSEEAPATESILEASQEMSGLLDDLLLTARIEKAVLVPRVFSTPLASLVRAAVEHSTRAEAHPRPELILIGGEVGIDSVPVRLDPKLMVRVLCNLLGNAFKYAGGGGRRIWIEGRTRAGTLRLEVRDEGPGIPASERERIFGQFVVGGEGRLSGHGIGLSFCRTAVEAHGGKIWVEEAQEGEAAFIIELPHDGPCGTIVVGSEHSSGPEELES